MFIVIDFCAQSNNVGEDGPLVTNPYLTLSASPDCKPLHRLCNMRFDMDRLDGEVKQWV